MEGLFAVIIAIIGIVNFVMKQQQEQNKHQGGTGKQRPVYKTQPSYKTQQPSKPVMEMKDFWNEGIKGVVESEGLEAEDRSRMGSMDYMDQSQSLEGECDEHPVHMRKKKIEQEKKPAPRAVIPEAEEEGIVVELTEEHLLSSFIMSEIIGPPRAFKRSIR